MRRLLKLAPLPLVCAAFLAAAALPAGAQQLRGPMVPDNLPTGRPRQDPPALPGLAGRTRTPVIPAEPNQASLGPTEALFDAINRGDMAAARDAMARGADLNARNVLGLSPIDSAVDQNRTDIAFFLLAARGTVAGSDAAAPAPPPNAMAAPQRGRSAAARDVPLTEPPARPARAAAAPRNPQPAPAPRYGAADGGTPQPDRGFLGFDAGRGG